MMELLLVNQEIAESRLFRATRSFSTLTGREIANLLYLYTITVYLLSQDQEQGGDAVDYAEHTSRYGGYSIFRTTATDLYQLAYEVAYPDNIHIRPDHAHDSKEFLKSLIFDKSAHWKFVKGISKDTWSRSQASVYLYRLEKQLRIKDSRYPTWRRQALEWRENSEDTRRALASKIFREIRRLGTQSDLAGALGMVSHHKDTGGLDPVPSDKAASPNKVMAAAVGALAGRYVADKIADKTGGDRDKLKTYGTGLGAIAGYWSAGRRQKQS